MGVMKVLSLRCAHDHRFDGWFANGEAFVDQAERGLVACPVCGDTTIAALPSAPRLNVSALRDGASPTTAQDPTAERQLQWMRAVQHMLNSTEDVGERFPEEARRIHYGEVEQRGIRGRASREDAQALHDEGIEVVAVPVPKAFEGPLQ
jgi:hypothetical protein